MENTTERLEKLTTREIAHEAVMILETHSVDEARKMTVVHREIVNRRLKELNKKLNWNLGTKRSAPQVNTISDFKRFR